MDEMTTNRGTISVNPGVNQSKGGVGRNSTVNTVSLSNSDGKILSRYLRPSMSSCHDFCKYGKKDNLETEGKYHFLRRSWAHNTLRGEERNPVGNLNLQERRKRPVIKQKTTFQPKEISDKPKVVKQNEPSPANEIDALGEPSFAVKNNTSHVKKSIYPEEVFPTTHKLRFSRGKVVDLQLESCGPRRLRFRKGGVVGERPSGNGELGGGVFKMGELGGSASSGPCSEAQNIVLRHHGTQEKDVQGLFNQVIEETATKLVEARKSKVKALVGAFETVISLQESKAASTI